MTITDLQVIGLLFDGAGIAILGAFCKIPTGILPAAHVHNSLSGNRMAGAQEGARLWGTGGSPRTNISTRTSQESWCQSFGPVKPTRPSSVRMARQIKRVW